MRYLSPPILGSAPSFTYDMAYERVRREHPEIFAAMRQPMRQGAEFNNKSNLSTKEGVAAVARQIEHGTRTPQQQHSAGVVIDAKAETEAVNAMFSQLNSSGWERYIRAHQEDVSGANARMIFTAVVKKWADKQDIQWADAWGQMAKSFDRPYQQMDVMPQAAY